MASSQGNDNDGSEGHPEINGNNCDPERMKLIELEEELKSRKLKTTGNKADLIERLKAALLLEDAQTDESEHESENESDYYEEEAGHRAAYVPTFKDVEESMEKFSGDGKRSLRTWLKDFEDTAKLCKWTDIQKLIYARRLLSGSAKLYVNYEKCTRTWNELKQSLCAEFSEAVNSHTVHKQLVQRKKREDESYHEYMYSMLDIAAQVSMEAVAVMQYVVDGIRDDELSKTMLYGAKNIKEFKDRLTQYGKMRERQAANPRTKKETERDETRINKQPVRSGSSTHPTKTVRCYYCGDKRHKSDECPTKNRGMKCFECQGYGHVAAKCPKSTGAARTNAVTSKRRQACKSVAIGTQQINALIDFGSDLSLIRAATYVGIGAPSLSSDKIEFRGVGSDDNVTLGSCSIKVKIDEDEYNVLFHVRYINAIFRDLVTSGDVIIYLDNIIVPALDYRDGLDRLNKVLVTASEYGLVIKWKTELHTDASALGFGAILLQRDNEDRLLHPIHYASGKTNPCEEKYHSYELEVLAVVKSLKKFRVYLIGIPFKVITDCQAFAMRHVDALSRYPLPVSMSIVEEEASVIHKIRKAQADDKELQERISRVNDAEKYVRENGLLYRLVDNEQLLVVPKAMQAYVIRLVHERGHFAVAKTEQLLRRDYWFDSMRPKIEKVIRSCLQCVLAERKTGRLEGYLHPIDKGDRPLETYHIDHLGPLASTKKNYRHILVVVDSFTKFVWLYPTKSTTSVESQWTSGKGESDAYPFLTKLAHPQAETWHKYVGRAQQYLNHVPSRSTGVSPFQLLIGTRMRLQDDPQEARDESRIQAKEAIARIQDENRKAYNRKRKKDYIGFKEGDLVAIRRTQLRPELKLCPKYLGPYQIIKVLRNDRYLVEKVGEHEGPRTTSTSRDSMKPWICEDHDLSSHSDEDTHEDMCTSRMAECGD
ncbi:uncharacterized protein LOC143208116 [Lasioglossum baleicum]|uniref:uncharacterized protein LOC143208116 n=1 Tax=Lasioglossum baleicum TaxID=434251 RepID=UPI003FCD54BA